MSPDHRPLSNVVSSSNFCFSITVASESEQEELPTEPSAETSKGDPTKFVAQKAKVGQKSTGKHQWEIMTALGIPEGEISKFIDANHWLQYFPPHGIVSPYPL